MNLSNIIAILRNFLSGKGRLSLNSEGNSNILFKNILIFTLFFWLIAFVFIPNAMVLIISFLSSSSGTLVSLPLTLGNYTGLFSPLLFKILGQSIILALIATIICLLLAFPFAYNLARLSEKWRNLLLVLIIIPFWTNSLVRTYSLIAILNKNGVLNNLLMWLGITDTPIEILYTYTSVVIGFCYNLLPFMILPLYSSLEKMDNNLLEAASDLGAGTFSKFSKIIIPLAIPGIIAGCIIVFLPALGMFYVAEILGGSNIYIIGSIIRDKLLISREWPLGSAISCFLTFLMFALIYLYYKISKRVQGNAGLKEGLI